MVFISDRHANIEAGISKVFPYATHTIYCWHFSENIKKRFHRKDVAKIIDKAARSYREFKYNRHIEELRNLHKGNTIIALLPVHTSGLAYTVPKEEFIRNMLQRWFHNRHQAAQSMRYQLTDASHLVILERVKKCSYMTVNPVDWNIFSVKLKEKQWTVNLAQKTCTCNKFQMDHFPCSHALATARERNLDLTSLCADYYKRETRIDAYSVPIMPVGHPSSWVVPSDIAARVVLNPKSKRQSGVNVLTISTFYIVRILPLPKQTYTCILGDMVGGTYSILQLHEVGLKSLEPVSLSSSAYRGQCMGSAVANLTCELAGDVEYEAERRNSVPGD
ncbi:hypothetical protein Dsin_000993 [Dipteronia sinensis]|uniref:SWIM-type domain-containing protein n=1 Tax=Dipteronia sinensis TaxID=43782 RepID=A0AAE0B3G0_9ROSI|nr:hypothetical protein Dsin_000993 [Dipteronia sinensis]